jgi:hypothetical protein
VEVSEKGEDPGKGEEPKGPTVEGRHGGQGNGEMAH